MRTFLNSFMVASLLVAAPAWAADLQADEIARRMSAALDTDRATTRTMEIVVRTRDGASITWSARQARKVIDGRRHILTQLVAPESVSGFAVLADRSAPEETAQWVYLPPVRRVRKVFYRGRFENFLGTDLSVEHFGFLALEKGKLELVTRTEKDGRPAYVLLETFQDPDGYSKIMTWADRENFLPIRREYYDVSGGLWKTERFEDVRTIDGVPTPLRITMTDEQQGGSTELHVQAVDHNVRLDASMFRPEALGEGLASARW